MTTSHSSVPKSANQNNHLPSATPTEPNPNGQSVAEERPPWTADADFERLQAPSFLASPTKSLTVSKIMARKPKGQEFVRVRPGTAWRGSYGLLREQRTDILYVAVPEIYGELGDELAYHLVVTAVNREGEVFLWPLPMSDSSGRANSWWDTAAEAAQRAETVWIRLKPDTERGRYDIREAQYALPEPQWPEQSFGELFRAAFKDVVIASMEHPFIRRLRGAP